MADRGYRILRATAVTAVLAWVSWSIYDGFVQPRTPEALALAAAHRAYADGDPAAARDGYRDVLLEHPDNLDARRGLARALMDLGAYDAALVQFDRAIAGAPDFAPTYANRGILRDRMGDYEQAIADYRRALELDPTLDDGPGWLTRFLRNQADKPPTIGARARYLAEQLARPPGERLLRVPEQDAAQRSYRVEE